MLYLQKNITEEIEKEHWHMWRVSYFYVWGCHTWQGNQLSRIDWYKPFIARVKLTIITVIVNLWKRNVLFIRVSSASLAARAFRLVSHCTLSFKESVSNQRCITWYSTFSKQIILQTPFSHYHVVSTIIHYQWFN